MALNLGWIYQTSEDYLIQQTYVELVPNARQKDAKIN